MSDPRLIVYVGCMYSREVLVFELNVRSGDLTDVQSIVIPGAVLPMAVSPDNRYLYAGLRTEPFSFASMAIDGKTGRLTRISEAPAAESMPFISTDRTGKYIFGITSPWHGPRAGRVSKISVSPIAPNGAVQEPTQILPTRNKAHCVLPSPSNRHVYASSCEEDLMVCKSFDARTGKLSSESTAYATEAGVGPRHFVFHPNNRLMYLLNETAGTIHVFTHDEQTGNLQKVQAIEVLPPDPSGKSRRAADIHITPNGKFLYASERHSDTIAAFKVDVTTGHLSFIGRYPTDTEPRGFNIDPLGRFVVTVGRMSDGMTVYAIDQASGTLKVVNKRLVGNEPPKQGYADVPPMKPDERGLRGPNWVEIISLA